MTEQTSEKRISGEQEMQREWARRELLLAAQTGETMHTQLMIGNTPVTNGMTFEAVRDELYRLLGEGLVVLDSHFRVQLTDKGREKLV